MKKRWTEEDLERLKKRGFKVIETRQTGARPELSEYSLDIPKPKIKRCREEDLQLQVAFYLKNKHPEVFFRSDFAAGIKMTMGQAVKHKRMQHDRGWPDMFIAHSNSKYAGLFLELKKDHNEVYKKDGAMRENEHIQEQAAMLEELKKRGYYATFACGLESCVSIIENYLRIA